MAAKGLNYKQPTLGSKDNWYLSEWVVFPKEITTASFLEKSQPKRQVYTLHFYRTARWLMADQHKKKKKKC